MTKITLHDALPIVEKALTAAEAEVGPATPHDRDRSWWDHRRAIMERCATQLAEQLDAKVNDRGDGCSLRIAGLAATSTMGFSQAAHNWIAAAKRRLA